MWKYKGEGGLVSKILESLIRLYWKSGSSDLELKLKGFGEKFFYLNMNLYLDNKMEIMWYNSLGGWRT